MAPQAQRPPRAPITAILAAASLALAACLVMPAQALAQDVRCHEDSQRDRLDGATGYANRTDRCEGTYRPMVSAPALHVAGFYETFDDFEAGGAPLRLSWTAPADGTVYVQVHSTKAGEAYRMDTQLGDDSNGFDWSTEVLSAIDLEKGDLAPAAFQFGSAALYLPLRIGQGGEAEGGTSYTLTVVPNTRLDDMQVTVAPVAEVGDFAADNFVVRNQPVGARRYLNRRPVDITISGLGAAGVYVAEITAIQRGGTPLPLQPVWFYHPGS